MVPSTSKLNKIVLSTAFILSILLVAAPGTKATAQRNISPVGCFHDLPEIEGDIFGFGVLKIWKKRDGYEGTFSERKGELGEHFKDTRLRNIRYDRSKHALRFDITFNSPIYTRLNARAIVSRRGIKLNVGKKMRAEYSGPNPFFRRTITDCF